MSVAKVSYVKRSRKTYRCEKCRDELPVGSAYRWFVVGFRSSYSHIRCMKTSCAPRPSERESSQMSAVLAALEDAEDQLSVLEWSESFNDELRGIAESVVEAINDVAGAYEEADQSFGGGGNTDMAERADNLRSAADELDSFYPDGAPDPCSEHDELDTDCVDCTEAIDAYVDEAKSELVDKLSDASSV